MNFANFAMTIDEYIDLRPPERADYIWTQGIHLNTCFDGRLALMLYRLPNFYVEIEFCRDRHKIIDMVPLELNQDWQIQAHIDSIDIDVF